MCFREARMLIFVNTSGDAFRRQAFPNTLRSRVLCTYAGLARILLIILPTGPMEQTPFTFRNDGVRAISNIGRGKRLSEAPFGRKQNATPRYLRTVKGGCGNGESAGEDAS